MNIVIVGAGAIGGWVGARLSLAGETVMALTRTGPLDHITINEHGETQTTQLTKLSGTADVLMIAVKATALVSAALHARTLIGPRTLIVPMLNGVPWWFIEGMRLKSVDPDGTVAKSLPASQVIGCVVHASCSRWASEVIVNHADKLIIGEPDGRDSERVTHLFGLLDRAGLRPELSDNIRRAIWYKLWGNATINPLSALTRVTCDQILSDPGCRAWMLEGMAELAKVGAAVGCSISESGEDRMDVTARLGAFKTSMLQDVEAGRPMELDALLGAPREIARARQIETPALDALYGVTRLMAQGLGLQPTD
jgi:2-dehydropantoate 2-reductase